MTIYFSASIVLSRKEQVMALPCDTSIIHSTLTKLPKDLDVDKMCQKACELECKYSSYDVQRESGVALDKASSINRFEMDWLPIETIEHLNDVLQRKIIPILQNTDNREPIELNDNQINKKETVLYAIMTLGAGIGILAILMSNSELVKEWLFTGV